MGGAPDLFVVCKNCRSEVSPYITECPYCGHRLRKRAPKLDKGAVPRAPRPARRPPRPSLGPLRERRAAAALESRRPYATTLVVLAAVVLTLAAKAAVVGYVDLWIGPSGEDVWRRALTSPFTYLSTGYEIVALGAIFLFGWLLERRHGPGATLFVFLASALGGMWVVHLADPNALAGGGNGAALGLLGAWAARDLLDRRRGEEVESDGLGVLVLAVVLVLIPAAVEEAHALAGAAGGVIGLLLGLPLARFSRR